MNVQIEELRKLPIAERLQIVEQLWEDIHDSDEPLGLKDWHQAEAGRRAGELDRDPDSALTRDEMWRRVDSTDG